MSDSESVDVTEVLQNPDASDDAIRDAAEELASRGPDLKERMKSLMEVPPDPSRAEAVSLRLYQLSEEFEETSRLLGRLLLRWKERGGVMGLEMPDAQPTSDPAVKIRKKSKSPPRRVEPARRPSSAEQPDLVEGMRHLEGCMESLGEVPSGFGSLSDVVDEMDSLEGCYDYHEWLSYPKTAQQLLISYLAARARSLQENADDETLRVANVNRRLNTFFPKMSKFIRSHDPGYVHGLSREHTAKRGSWVEDARHWKSEMMDHFGWEEPEEEFNPEVALNELSEFLERDPNVYSVADYLVDLLEAGMDASDPRLIKAVDDVFDREAFSRPELKDFRKARRDFHADGDSGESVRQMSEWEHFSYTEGMDACLIGVGLSGDRVTVIEDAFGFESLQDVDPNKKRQVQAAAERIRSGSFDIIIHLLGFTDHATIDLVNDAADDSGTPVVLVNNGRNPNRIKYSFEEQLAGSVT